MAWTTPKTWAGTDTITAALLNEQLRDNMNYLKQRKPEWVNAGDLDKKVQVGEQTVTFATESAKTATVTWATAFGATPVVTHSIRVGSNNDVLSNLQTVSTTQGGFRLFTRGLGNVTGDAFLAYWAVGA